jgi:hypothetical protein
MKFRKLRIAWSVAWGIVAVLLCVLWVRSYWYQDGFLFRNSPVMFGGISLMGSVATGVQQGDDDMPTLYAKSLSIEAHPWLMKSREDIHTRFGFAVTYSNGGNFFVFPHVFGVLTACAIGALPWLRFSLRTLLIATTLVALVLGSIVWLR